MYLKSLRIVVGETEIRCIKFHVGLNLIVDETHSENLQESGNNVGKTTVLRLIDFCLGSDGTNIYQDPEFKDKSNTNVRSFLTEGNVVIELALGKTPEPEAQSIKIRRNFLKNSLKIQEINGEEILNNKEFDRRLKELFFDSVVEKPTFRQIVAKNIRDEKNKLINTIRVLHQTTTFEQYEALYFFLFGISTNDAEKKQQLTNVIKDEERTLLRLRKETSKSELEQALVVVERDIVELETKKATVARGHNSVQDTAIINEVNAKINVTVSNIGALDIRRRLIIESRDEIISRRSNIDLDAVRSIYDSAKRMVPSVQKTFEDLVAFHNNMIENRIQYVQRELPALEEKLMQEKLTLEGLKRESDRLRGQYFGSDLMSEYDAVIGELNKRYEQRGRYREQLSQLDSIATSLENHRKELEKINDGSFSVDEQLSRNIEIFNKYFSKFSKTLYDEQFILSYEKNERAYFLKIGSLDGNLGTGKKKGQIAAFDFAYACFCEETGIPYLHFILHDQLENMHGNQLILVADLARELGVQLVLPFLKDKLPQNRDFTTSTIISLSQTDKLFRIE